MTRPSYQAISQMVLFFCHQAKIWSALKKLGLHFTNIPVLDGRHSALV
jgi:hypothetical protein